MIRKIEIQLSKGDVFQISPTKLVIQRLIANGNLTLGEGYKARYSSTDGKVIVEIDDTKLPARKTIDELETEARDYCKDESRFKE